jgi:WD40 repeat protein
MSPDGTTLAYTDGDRVIHLIDLKKGTEYTSFPGTTDTVKNAMGYTTWTWCSFSSDGKYLLVGGSDNRISLVEAHTGAAIATLPLRGLTCFAANAALDVLIAGDGAGFSHIAELRGLADPAHSST